jgi:hypothetical protein
MRKNETGTCDNCGKHFGYYLIHSGFNNSFYAYCDRCGCTALLSAFDKRLQKPTAHRPVLEEIALELERLLAHCRCGGQFRKGASPRCPHCTRPLSPNAAASFIERNATGAEKGWRWQRSWSGTYCIVIEENSIQDALKS